MKTRPGYLMNIECSVIESLKIALTFDDNKVKEREIAVGDLCSFEFNKNGRRKMIEGKIIKICAADVTNTSSWYIIVDGSMDYFGQMERFCPNQILDVDIIQKHDTLQYISTPNDSTRISSIRVVEGVLQVSTDGGYSWFTPKNVVGGRPNRPDKPECEKPHRPECHKPIHCHKPVIIEGEDEEENPDPVVPDEGGTDMPTEDGTL